MKSLNSIALVAGLLLGACSKSEPKPFVLVADNGQIGAGATLTLTGKLAVFHTPPPQGATKGFDATMTLTENVQDLNGAGTLTFTSEEGSFGKGGKIVFTKANGLYVCNDCGTMNLPVTWHLES